MEWIILIFCLLYVASLIWNISTDNKDERFFSAILLTIFGIIFIVLLSSYADRNTPTALDVYQGKTTLEITYRDSIPVDTIVVFNTEFRK
jgi:hypothetical protein